MTGRTGGNVDRQARFLPLASLAKIRANRWHAIVFGAGLLFAAASPAWAEGGAIQEQYDYRAALDQAGQNPTQAAVARALSMIGPHCATAVDVEPILCSSLLDPRSDAVLSNADMAAALQSIAPEEYVSQGMLAVEGGKLQLANVASRLQRLRHGNSGLGLQGFAIRLGGRLLSFADVLSRAAVEGAPSQLSLPGLPGKLGFFVTGTIALAVLGRSDESAGHAFTTPGLTFGADYRVSNRLTIGLAGGLTRTDASFDGDGGSVLETGYTTAAYGAWRLPHNLLVSGVASVGWDSYESERRIRYPGVERIAYGQTNGRRLAGSLGLEWGSPRLDIAGGEIDIGFDARLGALQARIDGFRETGAGALDLELATRRLVSMRSAVGMRLNYSHPVADANLAIQFDLSWRHEYSGDRHALEARFAEMPDAGFALTTEMPDRDSLSVGARLNARISRTFTLYLDYRTRLSRADFTQHVLSSGLSAAF